MAIIHRKLYGRMTAGLAAAAVLLGSFLVSGRESGLERFVFDRAQRIASTTADKGVVVIGIDADSRSHLGEWPWPNSLHAQLIDQLRRAGSGAVVFTTPLSASHGNANLDRVRAAMAIMQSAETVGARTEELRQLLSTPADALEENRRLADAMTAHGRVFLPADVTWETGDGDSPSLPDSVWPQADLKALESARPARLVTVPSESLLRAARGIGHVASPTDADGVWRRELAAVKVGAQLLPALSIRALGDGSPLRYSGDQLSLGVDNATFTLEPDLSVVPHTLPTAGAGALPTFSYWEVLAGKADLSRLKDKVVFIGFTDGANADRVNTPADPAVARAMVTAATTQSLMDGSHYRRPLWAVALQVILSLTVIAFAAAALPAVSLTLGGLLSGGFVLALLSVELGLLAVHIWLPLTAAALAVLAACLAYAALGKRLTAPGAAQPAVNSEGLRTLALTLQGQGQLDLAFETFQRCPVDTTTMDLVYRLGIDYERRRQLAKAADVYTYLTGLDPSYRDAKAKAAQYAKEIKPVVAVSVAPAAPQKNRRLDRTAAVIKTAPPATPAPAKETLGRYEIERQLGKGAMGVVYLGRDPKINRIVAIKAIPLAEEFEDNDLAEARERFFREAEMAGRLNHPSIVTVYDAGEDRGLAYIAMEFLSGEHLSFYAEPQNLLPAPKVLSLVARLADALDYAHRQNVIHRDIKPANIMFNVETDALKITDFGIARLTDVSRTKTGIVLGTPSFMSPEQLEGRSIDGRSDLFALGVTLYQLLSAQLPFRADSMTRLMNKIATEPHTPIRSIRPELPSELEAILERALAKLPERRFQRGAEMAEALRNCMRSIAA